MCYLFWLDGYSYSMCCVLNLTIGCSCVLSHRMFTLHICSQCAIRCDCLLSLNVFLSQLIMFILCFDLKQQHLLLWPLICGFKLWTHMMLEGSIRFKRPTWSQTVGQAMTLWYNMEWCSFFPDFAVNQTIFTLN